ncbi:MAG: hypothetical protein KDC92_01015 [Bacteroidetes bacterium]|nr:hypothetical protein [Bacteroidota bacterium]
MNKLITLIVCLVFVACAKDQLTQSELDKGKLDIDSLLAIYNSADTATDDTIVVEPSYKCKRRMLKLNVDSALRIDSFNMQLDFLREVCECDTIDIKCVNTPNNVSVIAWTRQSDTTLNFSSEILEITDNIRGYFILEDRVFPIPYYLSFYVDFDNCE